MEKRFKVLRVFSIVFKVIAALCVVFLGVGLAGVAAGGKPENVPVVQVVVNVIAYFSILFLTFYSLGEIIRVLLAIEEQTRKQ